MTMHVDPVGFTLRWYGDGKSHDAYDQYETVASLFVCEDVAIVYAMHGKMTRQYRAELVEYLLGQGIRDLLIIRHGHRIWYETKDGTEVGRRVLHRDGDPLPEPVTTP